MLLSSTLNSCNIKFRYTNGMQVSLAQIRVKSGDIEGNLSRIIGALNEVPGDAEVVLFPEMCVSGYNCGCLFEYEQFIQDCLFAVERIAKEAATINKELIVVVGSPRFADKPQDDIGNVRLHNSAFVLKNGRVLHVYDKRILANDYHHEDRKYFVPGSTSPLVPDLPLAILICEDIWHEAVCDDLYNSIRAQELKNKLKVQDLLVLNFSYYCAGKLSKRHELAQNIAQRGLDVHYCNAVGVGDITKNILLYDGASFVAYSDGGMLSADRYTSGVYSNANMWVHSCPSWESETFDSIVYAVRYAWEEFGLKCVQVHLSGGVDSGIVGVVAVYALGAKNVVFVTNPGQHTSKTTLKLANQLADSLQVLLEVLPVFPLEKALNKVFEKLGAVSAIAQSTISAVGRTVIGLTMTNQKYSEGKPTGILATGNHTENYLGWCNFHDIGSIGVMQPIGDLTKTELFSLCRYINQLEGSIFIPAELLDGTVKPMAELADTDVDPFDYYLYSGICAEMLRNRTTPRQLIEQFEKRRLDKQSFPGDDIYKYGRSVFVAACDDVVRRSKISVYKSAQHAPVLVLSKRTRGFSARETLINHYKWDASRPTGRAFCEVK